MWIYKGTQISLLNSTSFIFSVEERLQGNFYYHINIEVQKIEQLWESIRYKVHVYSAISDAQDGNSIEFSIFDNNNNLIKFYEKNKSNNSNWAYFSIDFSSDCLTANENNEIKGSEESIAQLWP